MRIVNKYRKFQEGGAMPAEAAPVEGAEGAPMGPEGAPQGGGEDPLMQILQVAAQALQSQDCQAAMAVCQALIELAQGGAGAGAPAEAAPEEPTFARQGAKLVRVRR